jgi:hypothetical protein
MMTPFRCFFFLAMVAFGAEMDGTESVRFRVARHALPVARHVLGSSFLSKN